VADDFFVFSDNEKLNLILSNLIANAITFNREAGKIEVIVKEYEGDLLISVKDTGIGIA
jgi:signal transduction histidine kinase